VTARSPEPTPGGLPAALAAGPFTDDWFHGSHADAQKDWEAAGRRWSQDHGLKVSGWVELLPADVAKFANVLGRCRARSLDEGARRS